MATDFKTYHSPLQIESFRFSDEGLYECNLDNGIEPIAIRKVVLRGEANSPPNISKPTIKHLNLSEGDDVNLICHCEMCDPLHMLMWSFESNHDTSQTNNSTKDIGSDTFNNIIDYPWKFKNVSMENNGTYTCTMNNAFGEDTYSIEMNVKQSLKIPKNELHHKCDVNKFVHLVDLGWINSNSTKIPSEIYDCSASDIEHNINITVVLIGKNTKQNNYEIDRKFEPTVSIID